MSLLLTDQEINQILDKLREYGYDQSPLIAVQSGAKAQYAKDCQQIDVIMHNKASASDSASLSA